MRLIISYLHWAVQGRTSTRMPVNIRVENRVASPANAPQVPAQGQDTPWGEGSPGVLSHKTQTGMQIWHSGRAGETSISSVHLCIGAIESDPGGDQLFDAGDLPVCEHRTGVLT